MYFCRPKIVVPAQKVANSYHRGVLQDQISGLQTMPVWFQVGTVVDQGSSNTHREWKSDADQWSNCHRTHKCLLQSHCKHCREERHPIRVHKAFLVITFMPTKSLCLRRVHDGQIHRRSDGALASEDNLSGPVLDVPWQLNSSDKNGHSMWSKKRYEVSTA